MTIEWDKVKLYLEIIGLWFAGAFVVFRGGKKIILFIIKEYKDLKGLFEKVDKISKEMAPNHGESIKDKIDRISDGLDINIKELNNNTKLTEMVLHRQRWIIDNMDKPVFEMNENCEFPWVNDRYCKLFRSGIQDLTGTHWKESISSDCRDEVIKEFEQCVKDKRNFEMLYKVIDVFGKPHCVRCFARVFENNGYMGTYTLITSEECNGIVNVKKCLNNCKSSSKK